MGNAGRRTLDPGQLEVVRTAHRLNAVAAPPGTGKTTALCERIATRIAEGTVAPHRVLAVTFTRRAAEALRRGLREDPRLEGLAPRLVAPAERVGTRVDAPPPMWIGTTHDFCARVLRLHAAEAGLARLPRTVGPEESHERMREAMRRSAVAPGDDGSARREAALSLRCLEQCKRSGRWRGRAPAEAEEWGRAWEEYEQGLRRDGAVDLPDLVLLTSRLLNEQPRVGAAWSGRFDDVLIDELQDTDGAVVDLMAVAGRSATIVAAGDPDQSIYGFRDAVRTFACLERLAPTHGAVHRIALRTDHRLSAGVQRSANRLRRHMAQPGPEPAAGGQEGWSDPVWMRVEEGAMGEVAQRLIRIWLADPGRGPAADARPGTYEDVVVVARKHDECRDAAAALASAQVPIRLGEARRRGAAVEALAAGLLAAAEPGSDAAWARALGAWPLEVRPKAVEPYRRIATALGIPLREALAQAMAAHGQEQVLEALGVDRARYAVLVGAAQGALSGASAWEIVQTLDLGLGLAARAAHDGEEPLREWEQAVGLARAQSEAGLGPGRVAEALDEMERSTRPEGEPKVTVMTMHAVKGLEYRHVLAWGWEEGVFPDGRRSTDLEEERRVAFVALTRASRHFVALCRRESRSGQALAESRFLHEAGIAECPAPQGG